MTAVIKQIYTLDRKAASTVTWIWSRRVWRMRLAYGAAILCNSFTSVTV